MVAVLVFSLSRRTILMVAVLVFSLSRRTKKKSGVFDGSKF